MYTIIALLLLATSNTVDVQWQHKLEKEGILFPEFIEEEPLRDDSQEQEALYLYPEFLETESNKAGLDSKKQEDEKTKHEDGNLELLKRAPEIEKDSTVESPKVIPIFIQPVKSIILPLLPEDRWSIIAMKGAPSSRKDLPSIDGCAYLRQCHFYITLGVGRMGIRGYKTTGDVATISNPPTTSDPLYSKNIAYSSATTLNVSLSTDIFKSLRSGIGVQYFESKITTVNPQLGLGSDSNVHYAYYGNLDATELYFFFRWFFLETLTGYHWPIRTYVEPLVGWSYLNLIDQSMPFWVDVNNTNERPLLNKAKSSVLYGGGIGFEADLPWGIQVEMAERYFNYGLINSGNTSLFNDIPRSPLKAHVWGLETSLAFTVRF